MVCKNCRYRLTDGCKLKLYPEEKQRRGYCDYYDKEKGAKQLNIILQ